jgi:hypothetical protein
MKQHKWHKEIKAWADGAEIEYKTLYSDDWLLDWQPDWEDDNMAFRIKPQPKEPQYLYVSKGDDGKPELSFIEHQDVIGKIKLEVNDDR